MPTDSNAAWTRLTSLLAERIPPLVADLNPPATEGDLDSLVEHVRTSPVDALTSLFTAHNGQRNNAAGLFFGLQFLSSTEAAEEWDRWMSVLADDPALATDIQVTSVPEDAARPTYYHEGWVPFAVDGAGNGFAVDLAPGPRGAVGQVISYGADESVRRVLAPSVGAFLDWFARALETGLVSVADDSAAPGGTCLHLSGASHPLDVADQVWGASPPVE